MVPNKGAVWIGPGGTYTKPFNNAGEDLILIIWAPVLTAFYLGALKYLGEY